LSSATGNYQSGRATANDDEIVTIHVFGLRNQQGLKSPSVTIIPQMQLNEIWFEGCRQHKCETGVIPWKQKVVNVI
jgi:hypothetical protein